MPVECHSFSLQSCCMRRDRMRPTHSVPACATTMSGSNHGQIGLACPSAFYATERQESPLNPSHPRTRDILAKPALCLPLSAPCSAPLHPLQSAPAHELEARPHDVRKEELHSASSSLSDHHSHPLSEEKQEEEEAQALGKEAGEGLGGEGPVLQDRRQEDGEGRRADQKEVLSQEGPGPVPKAVPPANAGATTEAEGPSPCVPASSVQEEAGLPEGSSTTASTSPAHAAAATAKAGAGPAAVTAAAAATSPGGAAASCGATGSVPAKEPVTCQVACLSWPGSKDGFKKSNQDAYSFMRTRDKRCTTPTLSDSRRQTCPSL